LRPQWIVGIILGVLLLYIGMFGASGIGLGYLPLQLAAGERFFTEDFNDNAGWTFLSDVRAPTYSNGICTLKAPKGTYNQPTSRCGMQGPDIAGFPLQYTVEIKMQFQSWGTGSTYQETGLFVLGIYVGPYCFLIVWSPDKVSMNLESPASYVKDANFHVWKITYDASTDTMKIYRDIAQVGSSWKNIAGNVSPIRFDVDALAGSQADLIVNLDYLYASEGIGGTPPPNEYGSIRAVCTKDGSAFSGVSLTVEGHSELGTKTSGSTGYATFTNVPVGDYQVKAVASGFNTAYDDVTVQKDAQIDAVFSYTTGSPDPEPDPDPFQKILDQIIAAIRNLLNNSSLKTMMMVGGGLITLVSVIMMVVPTKRYAPTAPF